MRESEIFKIKGDRMNRKLILRTGIICWIMIMVFTIGFKPAESGELGHYMPGVASVRDFIVPAESGIYYVQYNLWYSTDTYVDRNGNPVNSLTVGPATINIEANIDAYAIQPTIIWSTPYKIFGAQYSPFIGVPIVNTSIQAALRTQTGFGRDIDESNWGLGDLFIKPLWLGWNSKRFGVSAGYGFYAPTGNYDDGAVDNTGLGFWTHEFQAGVTWYPWEHQGTAIMINGTYEIHTEKDDVDITPGDRFSIDYGISQYLPVNKEETLLLELGLSGYSQWQVDNDSGSAVTQALNVKDKIHGFGGQIGLASIPWNASITLRYINEYDAKARFEGNLFTLTFAKGF